MWLVRTALRRPYTFVVLAMFIALGGTLSVKKAPTDIFPAIDIPVVTVIWNYGGLPPEEMERRIVNNFEGFLTTIVANIDHIESQSLNGIAVIKIYLQPGASVDQAIAQATAIGQTAVRSMPPGTVPPFITRYSATSVPIMQLALETDTMSETEMFYYALNFIRKPLAAVPGAQIPYPYGGKQPGITVDIDPARLQAWQLSPRDVQNALSLQNVILPSGTAKLGTNEYPIIVNASPASLDDLGALPIKTVGTRTVYVRNVANVRNGGPPQTNMVHVIDLSTGLPHRSALMTILKNGDASTLAVTDEIKARLPAALDSLPKEARGHLSVKILFDQSLFVRASVDGVVREAVVAAVLTALMILLFLRSWRSTFVVVVSIPLAILTSIIALYTLGYTINVMTLGGLALAVGILVDDATVEIENIHRNAGLATIHTVEQFSRVILTGAQQIAVPAFVSTLCICIVFTPIAFLSGASKYLFMPLGLAVVFAMLMSYFLSRTLVPTLVRYVLAGEVMSGHAHEEGRFDRMFNRFRRWYGGWLAWALDRKGFVVAGFGVFLAATIMIVPLLGRDFFPSVDAGLIKLHVRGVPGTRIEETEHRIARIEESIRRVIPSDEIETMLDIIGTPYSGINLSLSEGALISPADAQILIALKPGHPPTPDYVRALRRQLRLAYPDTTFFFLAPDISTQVLNLGLAAPIDLQVVGPVGSEDKTAAIADELAARVRNVPGAADVHLAQVSKQPELLIDIDRTMAQQVGLSEKDVASDLLVSLSSSGQVSPSFWVDKRGIQYTVAVQTPQYAIDSVDALAGTPISTGGKPQTLGNLASVKRIAGPANVTHFGAGVRTWDVQANVEDTDLGSVIDHLDDIVTDMRDKLKKEAPGTTIELKGQAESMETSFSGLESGLLYAVILVYLIMVVNFQSWLDPLVILMALPGALAGIAWILYVTGTTLSVPALIGSIMCVGVATANSILVVSFANDQRAHGHNARDAALAAGMTRVRPVLMTALAMIIGMVPMAIGLGEGGEQNAPLGRAVIGGLGCATLTTLFFVPVMYSVLRRAAWKPRPELEI